MSKFNWGKAVEKLYQELQYIEELNESKSKENKLIKYNLKCYKLYGKAREYGLEDFIEFKFDQLIEEDTKESRMEELMYG